ncbi:MAG: TIGR02757 family protein [Bacteroidetes bacterium]|nr:TIGR02757 family protein [Bacteroidota bacterium]
MVEMHVQQLLETKYQEFNQPEFIEHDPISIPHLFTRKQDIEIAGFIAAIFAWGQRKTIINKSKEFLSLMDDAPFDFIMNHTEADVKPFLQFAHRTFQPADAVYFIHWLQQYYREHESLEFSFARHLKISDTNIGPALNGFQEDFFSIPHERRTEKHIPTPARGSTCKRLNMFLRWMVRRDNNGVDFGIWKTLDPALLLCPLDVHVGRVARRLGLVRRTQTDWQTVLELTRNLCSLDPKDPARFDFALFGLGISEKYSVPIAKKWRYM